MAEALQTCLRAEGVPDAYEPLKAVTRGRGQLNLDEYREILASLTLTEDKKTHLMNMTPLTYVGEAANIARLALKLYPIDKL